MQRQIVQTLTFSYLVLDAPEVSAEVYGFTGVSLNWSAVEGADAYEIYRTEKTEDDSAPAVPEEPVYRTEDGSGTLSWQDEGVLYGTVCQNPYGMGYATIVMAARAAAGLPNSQFVDSGFQWLDSGNINNEENQKYLYK